MLGTEDPELRGSAFIFKFFLFILCYSYPLSRTVQLVEMVVGLLLLGVGPYSGIYVLGNKVLPKRTLGICDSKPVI